MKLRLIILSSILCLSSMGRAQVSCAVDNKVFSSGEKIQYQLYFNLGFLWIQAGTSEFKVSPAIWNKKPVYQLMIQFKTQKSFDSFFKVRDTIVSYVDTERLTPYRAYKFAHEDNWHGTDEFTFIQEAEGWRIYTRLKRKHQWKEQEEFFTSRCGFDLVTSLYRLRCLTDENLYKVGHRSEIPVRLDDGEYNLSLTYLGKQRIKLYGDGYYSTHAFQMTMIEGNIFKRGDVMKMWISDDRNKIPLLIESPIRVGAIKAIFRGAEHTRYPLQRSEKK